MLRDEDGNLRTPFPYRRGTGDQKYFHYCPITRRAKEIIDEAILRCFAPPATPPVETEQADVAAVQERG